MFGVVILALIIAGSIFLICKWEYDSQESLTKLESLLRSGKWQYASMETGYLIALIIHRDCKKIPCVGSYRSFLYKFLDQRHEKAGIQLRLTNCRFFSTEDMENFPLHKLQAIDNLWTKYSQGEFGFSVQASMYQKYGNTANRSIRNDEFRFISGFQTKVIAGQVDDWNTIDFWDYIKRHERELLLRLRWMREQNSTPRYVFCFSYDLDKSNDSSDTYLTPVRGMFPCCMTQGSGYLCNPTTFFLWRKIVRGSAVD